MKLSSISNTFAGGWVAGWLEKWRVMLISTQVVVVGVELRKILLFLTNTFKDFIVRKKIL